MSRVMPLSCWILHLKASRVALQLGEVQKWVEMNHAPSLALLMGEVEGARSSPVGWDGEARRLNPLQNRGGGFLGTFHSGAGGT